MRLFLDATAVFSAARSSSGRALALFRLADAGRCSLAGSNHVMEEARRNLIVKAADRVKELDRLLALVDIAPEAPLKLVTWAADHRLSANDAPVLAAAVLARADLLVTADRAHFGHLFGTEVGGLAVSSLAGALERVLSTAGSELP
jgi:predicted nucleic acid-binding protein